MAEIDQLMERLNELEAANNALAQQIQQHRVKDLTVASTLKEWNGILSALPVKEFFNNIDAAATMGNLDDNDKAQIVKLKVSGPAAEFLHSRPDLTGPECTYDVLKTALEERFKEKLPDNYHYSQLQTASQKKDETPEAFADRVKSLSLKTIMATDDPTEKRILAQEAERRLLAAYIAGLRGEVGRQVRLRMPRTMKEAIQLAVTTDNLEKKDGRDYKDLKDVKQRSVFAFDVTCYNCNRKGHIARDCRSGNRNLSQNCQRNGNNVNLALKDKSGRDDKKKIVTCNYCNKRGHIMKDCRKRQRDLTNPSGKANASSDAPTTKHQ